MIVRSLNPVLGFAFTLTFAALAVPSASLYAQARTPGTEACSCRLDTHRFILGARTQNPFVGTQIHTSTGGGMAFGFEDLVDVPLPDSSVIKALTGDLAYVALGVDYQQQLWQRFAVGLGITASARLGIDAESILSQGVTSVFSGHLWFKGQIVRANRHLLSATLDYRPNSAVAVDPIGWAERIIEDGGISDDNELVKSTDAGSASLGLQYAWALAPWVGLLASTDLGFHVQEITERLYREARLESRRGVYISFVARGTPAASDRRRRNTARTTASFFQWKSSTISAHSSTRGHFSMRVRRTSRGAKWRKT